MAGKRTEVPADIRPFRRQDAHMTVSRADPSRRAPVPDRRLSSPGTSMALGSMVVAVGAQPDDSAAERRTRSEQQPRVVLTWDRQRLAPYRV